MESLLYFLVSIITRIHNSLLSLNDGFENSFTDKELHFIVIGILGIALIFVIHPIFRTLADGDHIMTISFIYVFTMIIVITFAIEIGQWATGTGAMEFADITAGILGFLAVFTVFAIIRTIIRAITRRRRRRK